MRRLDAELARQLTAIRLGFQGYAGLWLQDLSTGDAASSNSDAPFPAASTVKLGVLIAALRTYGPRPERLRAAGLIRDLATWSSNDATNRLLLLLGHGSESAGSRVAEEALHRAGAVSSTFPGGYRLGTAHRSDAPAPPPLLTYRRTTARDLARLLYAFHAGALGNRPALTRLGLTRHEARVGLALLLSSATDGESLGLLRPWVPAGVPVAKKEGWTKSVRHTAAIVFRPAGPWIAVVLTYRPGIGRSEAAEVGRRLVALLR